jgi:gamma-glutamyl:cysteine ligase YbdK (ATP-grasp superfamily)
MTDLQSKCLNKLTEEEEGTQLRSSGEAVILNTPPCHGLTPLHGVVTPVAVLHDPPRAAAAAARLHRRRQQPVRAAAQARPVEPAGAGRHGVTQWAQH